MIPKNKLLTSSTIPYLPKTKLGSLLITSKLPMFIASKKTANIVTVFYR